MQFRPLGRTGLKVSALCLGGNVFGFTCDEPTSHLDHETAQALMDDVLDVLGEKTLLFITHRSEGLERMDEILELDDGRIVAGGGGAARATAE